MQHPPCPEKSSVFLGLDLPTSAQTLPDVKGKCRATSSPKTIHAGRPYSKGFPIFSAFGPIESHFPLGRVMFESSFGSFRQSACVARAKSPPGLRDEQVRLVQAHAEVRQQVGLHP